MSETTAPTFTILLPVHRPPALLPYAIQSVQAQERQDFELFVICDGTPAETAACARTLALADPRIRVFEHPKGKRSGEIYRHQALQGARGEYVCQIADDDLWLPHHLTEMAILLRAVDFGNISMVWITPDGKPRMDLRNLSDPATRQRMLTKVWNFFGPTSAGYRLSAYRSLPQGWSPAPPSNLPDLFMWRKFLARENLSFGTRYAATSAHMATGHRVGWSLQQRAEENRAWLQRFADPAYRDAFHQAALAGSFGVDKHYYGPRASPSWRLARPLRALARRLRRGAPD